MKERGDIVYKIHGHAMQETGIPDLYVYSRLSGGGAWVELKGEKTVLQKNQLDKLKLHESLGDFCCITRIKGDLLIFCNHLGEPILTVNYNKASLAVTFLNGLGYIRSVRESKKLSNTVKQQ